jgi:hypothetical protein
MRPLTFKYLLYEINKNHKTLKHLDLDKLLINNG